MQKPRNEILEEYVQHILKNIPHPKDSDTLDKTWWMLEQNRKFSMKSS